MSDQAWKSLEIILPSFFSLLAILFAKQARDQGRKNERKIDAHEAAAAARNRVLTAEMKAPAQRRLND